MLTNSSHILYICIYIHNMLQNIQCRVKKVRMNIKRLQSRKCQGASHQLIFIFKANAKIQTVFDNKTGLICLFHLKTIGCIQRSYCQSVKLITNNDLTLIQLRLLYSTCKLHLTMPFMAGKTTEAILHLIKIVTILLLFLQHFSEIMLYPANLNIGAICKLFSFSFCFLI